MVEGLLNSWWRVSYRLSWIWISKTPARKPTDVNASFYPPWIGGQRRLLYSTVRSASHLEPRAQLASILATAVLPVLVGPELRGALAQPRLLLGDVEGLAARAERVEPRALRLALALVRDARIEEVVGEPPLAGVVVRPLEVRPVAPQRELGVDRRRERERGDRLALLLDPRIVIVRDL